MGEIPLTLQSVSSFSNLVSAYRKAARGKTSRPDVAAFSMKWEDSLLRLSDSLADGTYNPGPGRPFAIHDKKTRIVTAVPFPDRIVHHAVCNVLSPVLEKSMLPHSCAHRKGKGTGLGLRLFGRFAVVRPFVLKCDIRKYFDSIDREILLSSLERKIPDAGMRGLVRRIVESAPGRLGLPLGNQTSQVWADWYLNGLDHFIADYKGFGDYVRYVDDFAVFGDNAGALQSLKTDIRERLACLKLELHEDKSRVYRTSDGPSFLGYRHFPTHRILAKTNVRRFKRRLRGRLKIWAAAQGTAKLTSEAEIRATVAGWCGHARQGDTYGLRKTLFEKMSVWNRGLGEAVPGRVWGFVGG